VRCRSILTRSASEGPSLALRVKMLTTLIMAGVDTVVKP
jgi:hypothetical protein